jgi:hypothetical protein
MHQLRRRKRAMTEALVSSTAKGAMRVAFHRLQRHAVLHMKQRQRAHLSELLLAQFRTGLRHTAFRRWMRHASLVAAQNRRRSAALAMLFGSSVTAKLRASMRTWQSFTARRRVVSARSAALGAMMSGSVRGRQLMAFARWRAFAQRSRTHAKRMDVARSLLSHLDVGLRRVYFNKLVAHRTSRLAAQRKSRIALSIGARVNHEQLVRLFSRWALTAVVGRSRRERWQARRQARMLAHESLSRSTDRLLAQHVLLMWTRFAHDQRVQRRIGATTRALNRAWTLPKLCRTGPSR